MLRKSYSLLKAQGLSLVMDSWCPRVFLNYKIVEFETKYVDPQCNIWWEEVRGTSHVCPRTLTYLFVFSVLNLTSICVLDNHLQLQLRSVFLLCFFERVWREGREKVADVKRLVTPLFTQKRIMLILAACMCNFFVGTGPLGLFSSEGVQNGFGPGIFVSPFLLNCWANAFLRFGFGLIVINVFGLKMSSTRAVFST